MADELRDWIAARYPSARSESPIEQLFHASLKMLWDQLRLPPQGVIYGQQEPVGNYRADFLFRIAGKDGAQRLVVELDGHDFHERTKQQAARDKARDRWMTGNGYIVVRFTGSEVWANPFKCVAEVADRIHQAMYGVTAKEARIKASMDAIRRLVSGEEA